MIMRILAFSAHPDDVEINCAGTLAMYRKKGAEVFIVHACTGDKGDYLLPPEQVAQIRATESRLAGKAIQAQVSSLNFGDAELVYNRNTLDIVVETIRNINPDVIITHTPEDYHSDHTTTSKLVVDASFLVTVPGFLPRVPAMECVPQIYFMEPYTGVGFLPEEYVDISSVIETKIEMMKCHKSQVKWLKEHDAIDIVDYIRTSGRYRGFQCGVAYAESFKRLMTALRAVPARFLP